MGKRSNGEGSIWKRERDGKLIRWEGAITYLDGDGNRRRKTVYGKTRADVKDKLDQIRERISAGSPVTDSSGLLRDWCKQWRETNLAASNRAATTKATYANLCRKHIEGGPLGDKPLSKIKPSTVDKFTVQLGEDGLSQSTVRQTYIVLRAALDAAVRDDLLAANPCTKAARPRVEKVEAKYLSKGDLRRLVAATEGTRYHLAVKLLSQTGLRRGEALALRWTDLDLEAETLRVNQTLTRIDGALTFKPPKSKRSIRTVPLTASMVDALQEHRRQQRAERSEARNLWKEHGLVFATEFGGPVDPRNLLRVVENAAKVCEFEGVGVHTIRHSVATAWLEAGVPIKTVADLLGHHSISVTGDIYGHTSDDAARRAVEGLGDDLG